VHQCVYYFERKMAHISACFGFWGGLTADAILRHRPCRVMLGTIISHYWLAYVSGEFGGREKKEKRRRHCAEEFVTIWGVQHDN